MTALERADPSFAPRAPPESCAGNPRARRAEQPRQDDVVDAAVMRKAFIRPGGEAAVGDGELRGAVEERNVTIQGRSPKSAVSLAALTHRVVGDELRLGFLDLHEPPKLGGSGQLALPDDIGVRLEQTHHFARIVRIAPEHASTRLSQHLPDQLDRRGQLGRAAPGPRAGQRSFGLAHHQARDPHEALVEDLHLRLALLADPGAHSAAGRATALGDLEDPAGHTARALADPLPDSPQAAGEHPDTVGQERGIRGVMNVGFDDGGVHAQAAAADDAALAPQGHQPGQHILEHGLVQQAGQPDQRLRVGDALAVDPAEGAIDQAAPHLPLALIDAVGTGLVASLARPGGNLTGLSGLLPDLVGKCLEHLTQAVPRVSRVAVLWQPGAYPERTEKELLTAAEGAGRALGVRLQFVEARSPADFDRAFSDMTKARVGALTVLPSALLIRERKRLVDLAAKHRLPAVYSVTEFVRDAGGLMVYGPNVPDLHRRAATYVDKILKGAKPADLPIEQPTKFEFVINLKTAKTFSGSWQATFF